MPRTDPRRTSRKRTSCLGGRPPSLTQLPAKILDRERLGLVERKAPQMGRHREAGPDVVEVGTARYVAQAADVMLLQHAQAPKLFSTIPDWGQSSPAHIEQAVAAA